jgi:hypothetical protein
MLARHSRLSAPRKAEFERGGPLALALTGVPVAEPAPVFLVGGRHASPEILNDRGQRFTATDLVAARRCFWNRCCLFLKPGRPGDRLVRTTPTPRAGSGG